MSRIRFILFSALVYGFSTWCSAASVTIIDNTTQGLYNQGIGNLLDGTSSAFPTNTDPTQTFATAPNLSAGAGALGNWLTNPANPGGSWTGPQAIPEFWAVTTETAIIYTINAGAGLSGIVANFGVDNGIFAWLDGNFLGGQMAPGGAALGEFQPTLPPLTGTHFLQILREDHGGATDYLVQITAQRLAAPIPEPETLVLLLSGLLGMAVTRKLRAK